MKRSPGFEAVGSCAKAAVLVIATLIGWFPDAFASEISLPSLSAAPGSGLVLSAVFNPQASFVSAIQFDLEYDNSAMSLVAVVADAARNAGKSLYSADLAPNRRRFLIAGLNQNLISVGNLMTVFVNLDPNASTGVYPLAISGFVATDPFGQQAKATGTDGAVTIRGTIDQSVRLQPTAVLNAGSLLPGPLAPGEFVTLIGSGIGPSTAQLPDPSPSSTDLGGTSVLIDGVPVPLLYADLNEIKAVIPYRVYGRADALLQITKRGLVIAELVARVAPAAPAIFTQDSSGVGAAAILNEDFNVNSPSSPATLGSAVMFFATGGGQISPPGLDGQLGGDPLSKPILPITVQIGGGDAEILSVGPAPSSVSGVLQIRCRVPLNATPAHETPIVLRVGTVLSQPGVTLALQ